MLTSNNRTRDRLMLILLFLHLAVVLPYSLVMNELHVNWLSVPAFLIPLFIFTWKPGTLLSRCAIAVSMVIFSSILIHLSNGLIEMHFHVFVMLVVLSLYYDWRVFSLAALGITGHHFFGLFTSLYHVYGPNSSPNFGIFFLHVLFVALECIFLSYQIHSFQRKIETISRQKESLTSASLQLLSATNALNSTASQQVYGSQQQADSISQTSKTLRDLTSSAEAIANKTRLISQSAEDMLFSAQKVNTMAEAVVKAGERGRTSVAQTVNSSQNLSQFYSRQMQLMADLQQRSTEIKAVITTIREMSDEIHLLALNATIEAKGAGPNGARFTVVAREVNELADRSRAASKQVEKILSQVEAQIQEAAQNTLSGQVEIQLTSQLAKRSGTAISELVSVIQQNAQEVAKIERLVEYVNQSAREISQATEEQYLACEQASKTLEEAGVVADQTVAGSSLLNNTAYDLEKLSLNLKQTIAA